LENNEQPSIGIDVKRKQNLRIATFPVSVVILLLWPVLLSAQHDLTLYSMDRVPQRIYLNPAFIPEQHGFVGVPFLSGIHAGIASPFSYNNILTRDATDSLNFEANHLIEKISKNDHVTMFTSFDILSVGTKIAHEKYYINFGVRERIGQNLYLPENLFYLLWYGNGAPQVYGKHVNISPAMNASIYDEFSFTFAGHAIKNILTYGVTLKYLSGHANVTTKKSQVDFYTDPATNNVLMSSDLQIETSGISGTDNGISSMLFAGNNGFAIDLGLNWQVNNHFSVNASVVDLGFINWHSNTMTLVSAEPGKEFTYSGMPLNEFVEVFTDFGSFTSKVFDTLVHNMHIDSVYGSHYRSNLPATFNIGGSYSPDERNHLNVVLNGISWAHHFYPAVSLAYMFDWSKHVGLTLSYNIFNGQYTNVGGGISVSAGAMQLYLASDNLPGLVFYKSTNNTSVQFGINIALKGKTVHPPSPDPGIPVQQAPAGMAN
jgi:hypothetical protein